MRAIVAALSFCLTVPPALSAVERSAARSAKDNPHLLSQQLEPRV